MFRRKLINGSFEWMGITYFMRADGPPWTVNILDLMWIGGGGVPSNSQNLRSESGGYPDSVHINRNQPACELPIYHRRVFENMCSAGHRACDNLLLENRTYRMKISSICQKSIRGRLVNRRDDTLDDR